MLSDFCSMFSLPASCTHGRASLFVGVAGTTSCAVCLQLHSRVVVIAGICVHLSCRVRINLLCQLTMHSKAILVCMQNQVTKVMRTGTMQRAMSQALTHPAFPSGGSASARLPASRRQLLSPAPSAAAAAAALQHLLQRTALRQVTSAHRVPFTTVFSHNIAIFMLFLCGRTGRRRSAVLMHPTLHML